MTSNFINVYFCFSQISILYRVPKNKNYFCITLGKLSKPGNRKAIAKGHWDRGIFI